MEMEMDNFEHRLREKMISCGLTQEAYSFKTMEQLIDECVSSMLVRKKLVSIATALERAGLTTTGAHKIVSVTNVTAANVTLSPAIGSNLADVREAANGLALLYNRNVEFKFNDQVIVVTPQRVTLQESR